MVSNNLCSTVFFSRTSVQQILCAVLNWKRFFDFVVWGWKLNISWSCTFGETETSHNHTEKKLCAYLVAFHSDVHPHPADAEAGPDRRHPELLHGLEAPEHRLEHVHRHRVVPALGSHLHHHVIPEAAAGSLVQHQLLVPRAEPLLPPLELPDVAHRRADDVVLATLRTAGSAIPSVCVLGSLVCAGELTGCV